MIMYSLTSVNFLLNASSIILSKSLSSTNLISLEFISVNASFASFSSRCNRSRNKFVYILNELTLAKSYENSLKVN